jgi:hypothetical protein
MQRANIWKHINRIAVIYRYGINSKPDIAVRYYRFESCRACCCGIYPQPVRVVRESGMNTLPLCCEKQNSGEIRKSPEKAHDRSFRLSACRSSRTAHLRRHPRTTRSRRIPRHAFFFRKHSMNEVFCMDIVYKLFTHSDKSHKMQRICKRDNGEFVPFAWMCPDCGQVQKD